MMMEEDMQTNTLPDNSVRSTNLERMKYIIFAVSFYIYVAGALYFYGLMNTLGFKGASLDSIFSPLVYSQRFVSDLFSTALVQGIYILLAPLKLTSLITLLAVCMALLIKFQIWKLVPKKLSPSAESTKTFFRKSPVISSFLTFPIFYLGHLATFVALISILSLVAIPLMLPYSMGTVSANNLVNLNEGKICEKFDWSSEEYKDQKIVLSCERVNTGRNNETVTGSIIHTDQKYAYVITNDVLFRIKDGKIASCVVKQHNSENVVNKDQTNKPISDPCMTLLKEKVPEMV
ncbi:TPA: hypothetical protein ACPHTW_004079 [Vibrio antiquarius]